MSRRPPRERPERAAGPAWLVRAIVAFAVLVLVAALVISIATGTLFTAPGR